MMQSVMDGPGRVEVVRVGCSCSGSGGGCCSGGRSLEGIVVVAV